jgi:hypothetical protein
MALKNLLVRVGADISGLQKGMKKAQKDVSTFSSSLSNSLKGIGTLLASIGAGMTLGAGIKDAMEFEAHMGTLNQTLGESTKGFQEWMNTTGKALGMSKLQLSKYGNQYSLTLKGIAKDQDDLAKKTQQTLEAVAIIRSKTGMEVTEISDRMRSAMNGEADGADELGVNVRVAAIEASKAYKMMSDGKPWEQLSANMQKAIRWQHTMDSITSNLGNTMANNTSMKMARFTASLQDMRLAMGQAWLPILNIALPALTRLSNALTRAFSVFAQFMSALFGYKADTSGGFGAEAEAAESLGDSVAGVGDAYSDAANAAKKAKGALAGFDEINSLADNSAATESAAGSGPVDPGGVGGGPVIEDPTGGMVGKLGEIEQKIQEFATKAKAWLSPLKEPWDNLKTAVKGVGTSLADLWNSDAVSKLRDWLANAVRFAAQKSLELLTEAFNTLSGAINTINGLVNGDHKKIMEGLKGIFDSNNESIKLLKASVIGLTAAIVAQSIIGSVTNLYKAWKTATTSMTTVQWLLNAAMSANPLGLIATAIGLVVTAGVLLYQNWDKVKAKASELWTGIKTAFGTIAEWFETNVKIPLTTVWTDIKTNISTKASEAWDAVKSKFTSVKTWFDTNIKTPIATVWSNIRNDIATKAGEAWNKVKEKFTSVHTWFKKNVADKIRDTFHGITDGLGDNIISAFKTVYNKAAGFINSMIGMLNKMIDKVPIPGLSKINIPEIPALAKGGITNGPTLAMIGDNPGGREVVSPLDDLQDIVASAVGTAVMQAMQFGNQSGQGGDTVINIDGRTFARIIKPYIDQENRRVGNNVTLNSI